MEEPKQEKESSHDTRVEGRTGGRCIVHHAFRGNNDTCSAHSPNNANALNLRPFGPVWSDSYGPCSIQGRSRAFPSPFLRECWWFYTAALRRTCDLRRRGRPLQFPHYDVWNVYFQSSWSIRSASYQLGPSVRSVYFQCWSIRYRLISCVNVALPETQR